jgi:O-antigen/teichoic acid export membrane protein
LLKKETIEGLIWSLADTFLIRGVSFLGVILIARLLGPAEFGLLGMISVFIAIGTSLVDSGLSSSLIRTQNADDTDFSTVFYLNLFLGCLVYLVVFLLSPYITRFYNQPVLIDVVRVYCVSFVISAFSSVQLAILSKELKFKKMMFYNIPGVVVGVSVGITLAFSGYGIWSVVWMYLTIRFIESLILWIFSEWKPTMTFSFEKVNFHYKFGYKLMLSGLIDTIFKNTYNVLIGKFYSVQSLGYYERANTFNEYPISVITGLINKVTYPLLSKIQDDKEKISLVYKQMIQLTFFITTPLVLGFAAIAKPIFGLILGEQWLPAVPLFQIICLASILYPIHSYNISVLKVYGRSDLFLKLELIKKIIFIIIVVIGFQFGILGLVWSSVISSFVSLVVNTHYSSSIIHYTTKKQIMDMVPIFLISSFVFIIMDFLTKQLFMNSVYIQIIVPSLVGFLIYIFINYLMKSIPLKLALNLIKDKN